jgi:hypothetical protein
MADKLAKILKRYEDMEAGTYQPERPPPMDPERAPLYGGISGLQLAIPEFQLCEGLVVRETYAHVFAPYMMAFSPPKRPGAPHPAPWKAAHGGLAFDISVEIGLARDARPTGLDRLNTIWWVLALLRLVTGAPLRMPVISDIAFAGVPSASAEPNLWTIEMPPRQFHVTRNPPAQIQLQHLEWVRGVLLEGARLLDNPAFNRSFQTFDSAIWAGSAVIMAWASLETLFRPGRRQITKTLAKCIAAFLHSPGPARDRTYHDAEQLYEARGSAAHDSQVPEAEQLLASFGLVRTCLIKCIDLRAIPQPFELLARWQGAGGGSSAGA